MEKSEVIAKAWGDLWESVKDFASEDGWVPSDKVLQLYNPNKGLDVGFEQSLPDRSYFKPRYTVRPITLRGITNNNGWKPSGYHDAKTNKMAPFENGKQYRIGFMNFDGSFHEQGIKVYNDGFKEDGYYLKPFPTHYIEIEEIKPPLHL